MTIHNDIKYFNKYLKDNLTSITVHYGEPNNYQSDNNYIFIQWETADIDTSKTYDFEAMSCRIQGYTRENNINAHYDLGATIIALLKHKVALSNGSTVEVRNIKPFYYQLADFSLKPIKKVDITFSIRKFKENI